MGYVIEKKKTRSQRQCVYSSVFMHYCIVQLAGKAYNEMQLLKMLSTPTVGYMVQSWLSVCGIPMRRMGSNVITFAEWHTVVVLLKLMLPLGKMSAAQVEDMLQDALRRSLRRIKLSPGMYCAKIKGLF